MPGENVKITTNLGSRRLKYLSYNCFQLTSIIFAQVKVFIQIFSNHWQIFWLQHFINFLIFIIYTQSVGTSRHDKSVNYVKRKYEQFE